MHPRTGAWAIAPNNDALACGEPALTLVQGDTDCVLSITTVKGGPIAAPVTCTLATPFVLASGFATIGVPFLLGESGATQFCANFNLFPDATFAANFVNQRAQGREERGRKRGRDPGLRGGRVLRRREHAHALADLRRR